MNAKWKAPLSLVAVTALVAACLVVMVRYQPAHAERAAEPAAAARYTVIDTEGHNLIVTDNTSNTLYYYTIDKDKDIGSELKLRGTLDLNQVGKPSIKPMKPKAE